MYDTIAHNSDTHVLRGSTSDGAPSLSSARVGWGPLAQHARSDVSRGPLVTSLMGSCG